jgi:hypothetical protein
LSTSLPPSLPGSIRKNGKRYGDLILPMYKGDQNMAKKKNATAFEERHP